MSTMVEQAEWVQEPTPEFVATFLRQYFRQSNEATKNDKVPIPMFGQILDKPNVRREYGGVVIDALMLLNVQLGDKSQPLTTPTPSAKQASGREIFEKIDEFREGPESLVPPEFRETIHNLAEGQASNPLVRLGKLALEGLGTDWLQERGMVQEAMVAIELHAISQSSESAA